MDGDLRPFEAYSEHGPDTAHFQLSPSGEELAWTAEVPGGHHEIRIAPVDDVESFRVVYRDDRPIWWRWAPVDGHHLLVAAWDEKAKVGTVSSLDTLTGTTRELRNGSGWGTLNVVPLLDEPGHVAMVVGNDPRRRPDATKAPSTADPLADDSVVVVTATEPRWRTRLVDVDLLGDDPSRVTWSSKAAWGVLLDRDGAIDVLESSMGRVLLRGTPDEQWAETWEGWWDFVDGHPKLRLSVMEPDERDFTLFGHGNGHLVVRDNRDSDFAGLFDVDLASGDRTPYASSDRGDVVAVWSRAGGLATETDTWAWEGIPAAWSADFAVLEAALGQTFQPYDVRGDAWLVRAWSSVDRGSIWLYRHRTGSLVRVDTPDTAFEDQSWRPLVPYTLTARDGVPLTAYLMTPDPAVFPGPWPLVVEVHGGPSARDRVEFRPDLERRADLGYASLAVNYRGSTDLGKAHEALVDGDWAGRSTDDVVDATEWAVSQGVADRSRLAISGGSYGGLTTLSALTRYPDEYACGIAVSAVGNLLQVKKNAYMDYRELGSRESRIARSPLTHVDALKAPLLVVHGGKDAMVPIEQVQGFVDAAVDRNDPITFVVFPDEGHGNRVPADTHAQWAIEAAFLHDCLGGRTEPLGPAMLDAKLEVRTGIERIPGLVSASGTTDSSRSTTASPAARSRLP
jgi:dipeptidyl aminopeptidase/acylaminoacyl peptidase